MNSIDQMESKPVYSMNPAPIIPPYGTSLLWRIFCVVPGAPGEAINIFGVYARPDATVSDLKELIKERKKMFSKIDANNLVLYHEEMPDDDQLAENLAKPRSTPRLRSTTEISEVFSSSPTRKRIHIVVELPRAGESYIPRYGPVLTSYNLSETVSPSNSPRFPPENSGRAQSAIHAQVNHTPPKPCEEVDDMISDFLTKCRPKMHELVKKAVDGSPLLEPWIPTQAPSKEFADHMAEMCIPTVSGGRPSLLLHDLGKERYLDKEHVRRIRNIFSLDSHTCVLYLISFFYLMILTF
jgi:hypothetical protein